MEKEPASTLIFPLLQPIINPLHPSSREMIIKELRSNEAEGRISLFHKLFLDKLESNGRVNLIDAWDEINRVFKQRYGQEVCTNPFRFEQNIEPEDKV